MMKDNTNQIYNKYILDKSADFEKVGWGSLESQIKRFDIFSEIGDLNNCSILDIGCGTGAFYKYLNSKYDDIYYTGTDINENMVKIAKETFSEATFLCTDILNNAENKIKNKKFDYVFLSGALNLSINNHELIVNNMMRKMFDLSNIGIALNFLSIYADFFSEGECYLDPGKVISEALLIDRKATLRHDYMPHDFTIYIFK